MMKMGTAQKQNISVQHRYFNKHGGRQTIEKHEPLSFEEWLKQGFEHFSKKGISFELVTPSLMRIKKHGQNGILRTCANFREEYEKEYLSKF